MLRIAQISPNSINQRSESDDSESDWDEVEVVGTNEA